MITTVDTPLADWQETPLQPDQIACWWLGQAGFLFRHKAISFIVDPYLSDTLAVKYQNKQFKHIRMMPVPIEPTKLKGIDWIFCTHQHTDHMDGGTLPDLMAANPTCKIMAPTAAEDHLFNGIGIERARTSLVDKGQHIKTHPSLDIDVMASAHEALEFDEAGHSVYLGYLFDLSGLRIYHSGDCVPYEGLTETLKTLNIDVALLPVNGRDEARKNQGVPGNFHFEEAVSLCAEAGINTLVPHHFGLFDFNTVNPVELQSKANALDHGLQVVIPKINEALIINGINSF